MSSKQKEPPTPTLLEQEAQDFIKGRDSIEEEPLKVLVPREQLAAPIFSALLATWVDTPLSKITPEDLVIESYRFVDLLLKHSNNNTNNNNNNKNQ